MLISAPSLGRLTHHGVCCPASNPSVDEIPGNWGPSQAVLALLICAAEARQLSNLGQQTLSAQARVLICSSTTVTAYEHQPSE